MHSYSRDGLRISIPVNQLSAEYSFWGKKIFLIFLNMLHGCRNKKKWLVDLKVTILLYWEAM